MSAQDRFTAAVREEAANLRQAAILRSVMRDLALAVLELEDPPEEPITFLIRPGYSG